jgi:hypothetical protein
MGKQRNKMWGGRAAGGPPVGQAFVWHTLELVASDAWRFRSAHCARLIDFLEAEHLKHGGAENGSLIAPYSQLQAFGIGRQYINRAIIEAETRKLIEVKRGGLKGRAMTDLNRFRLTYYWMKFQVNGFWDWRMPGDEWKTYSEPKAEISSRLYTSTVHNPELAPVHNRILPPNQAVEIAKGAVVPDCILPSISWGGDQKTAPTSVAQLQRSRSAPQGAL